MFPRPVILKLNTNHKFGFGYNKLMPKELFNWIQDGLHMVNILTIKELMDMRDKPFNQKWEIEMMGYFNQLNITVKTLMNDSNV